MAAAGVKPAVWQGRAKTARASHIGPSAHLRRAAANTQRRTRPVTVARGWLSAGDRHPGARRPPTVHPPPVPADDSRSVLQKMAGTHRKRRNRVTAVTVTRGGFAFKER